MWIYRRDDGGIFSHYFVSTKAWPWGRIVGVTSTLWGARRLARREMSRCDEGPVLVEVVEAGK